MKHADGVPSALKPYAVAWVSGDVGGFLWRVGRVVEGSGLLIRRAAMLREFESLTLRTPATECCSRISHESDRELMNIKLLALVIKV